MVNRVHEDLVEICILCVNRLISFTTKTVNEPSASIRPQGFNLELVVNLEKDLKLNCLDSIY